MKFTDGYWLKRPGVTVVNPKEVCDIKIQENSVTLYISPWNVTNRGMTLQGPLVTLTFTSPRQDILAAEITHFQGGNKKEARFQLNKKDCELKVEKSEDSLIIKSGKTTAEIKLSEFAVVYKYGGRYLTSTGFL
jgi:hypothetical protein